MVKSIENTVLNRRTLLGGLLGIAGVAALEGCAPSGNANSSPTSNGDKVPAKSPSPEAPATPAAKTAQELYPLPANMQPEYIAAHPEEIPTIFATNAKTLEEYVKQIFDRRNAMHRFGSDSESGQKYKTGDSSILTTWEDRSVEAWRAMYGNPADTVPTKQTMDEITALLNVQLISSVTTASGEQLKTPTVILDTPDMSAIKITSNKDGTITAVVTVKADITGDWDTMNKMLPTGYQDVHGVNTWEFRGCKPDVNKLMKCREVALTEGHLETPTANN